MLVVNTCTGLTKSFSMLVWNCAQVMTRDCNFCGVLQFDYCKAEIRFSASCSSFSVFLFPINFWHTPLNEVHVLFFLLQLIFNKNLNLQTIFEFEHWNKYLCLIWLRWKWKCLFSLKSLTILTRTFYKHLNLRYMLEPWNYWSRTGHWSIT